jgi:hypothetical protein
LVIYAGLQGKEDKLSSLSLQKEEKADFIMCNIHTKNNEGKWKQKWISTNAL